MTRAWEHLKYKGISSSTRSAYAKQVNGFFLHIRLNGLQLPRSMERLDELISEYINHMWLEGEPQGYAGHLLSGLARFMPVTKGKLHTSWQYFNNWRTLVHSVQASPLL